MKKLHKKGVYISALTLLLVCCQVQKKNILELFKIEKKLQHEKIEMKHNDYLFHAWCMYKTGNYLVINDDNGKTYMSIFDLKEQRYINHFIKKGAGPNEMFSPPQSITPLTNNQLSYFDAQARIIYQANYSKPDSIKITKIKNFTNTQTLFLGLIPMAYDYYVGIGLIESGRYAVIDKNGKNVSINFDYPKDEMKQGNNFQKALAYQGGLIPNSDKTKFFFYCISSEILEIMQLQKNGTLTKIRDIHFDYATYRPEGDGKNTIAATIMKESKAAFISATATSNYIYLLYSGRTIGVDINLAFKSNTILVFDWEGNPIKRYNLDIDITTFTVSEDDKTIYAISNTSVDTDLIKFKM